MTVVTFVVLAPDGKTGRVIDTIHTTRWAAEERMADMPTAWLEEHSLLGVVPPFLDPSSASSPAAPSGGWREALLRWLWTRWSGTGLGLGLLGVAG